MKIDNNSQLVKSHKNLHHMLTYLCLLLITLSQIPSKIVKNENSLIKHIIEIVTDLNIIMKLIIINNLPEFLM